MPFSDWYKTIDVVIKPDDYYYFRIERRFGSWWLIGLTPKDEPKYHWKNTQIGEMAEHQLKSFIEWAKNEKGSKIIEFKAISGEFNILEEIIKIVS
jgi:hypothetical protein